MQTVFTMQYGEYRVANYLRNSIKNCSVFIPSSHQEKGIDLVLYRYSQGVNKFCTIQVKMSRVYEGNKSTTKYPFHLWFNRYEVPDNADWNVLVGIYPDVPKPGLGKTTTSAKWGTKMLAFRKDEMKSFISECKQKKDKTKNDSHFIIGFGYDGHIYQTRGYVCERDLSHYLIENRLKDIENDLNTDSGI